MGQAGAIQLNHAGIAFRPDRVVEKAVGPLRGIDAFVAVGVGKPGTLMRDQETYVVALATSYSIMSTISSATRSG
jgi:hypothetical protein